MSSPENGADIPLTPRLAQINADILAEQARLAFVDETIPDRFRLVLPKNTGQLGPEVKSDAKEPDTLAGDGKFKITLTPFADSNQPFADRISDKIFPGFGRIESTTSKNQWRVDFVDPRRCKTNTKLGVCFTMKLR